jgi:hypothetical protein
MNESENVLLEKWKELIPHIDLEYYIHQLKPEYQEDFFQKMYMKNKKMEREMNGGNKKIHSI